MSEAVLLQFTDDGEGVIGMTVLKRKGEELVVCESSSAVQSQALVNLVNIMRSVYFQLAEKTNEPTPRGHGH